MNLTRIRDRLSLAHVGIAALAVFLGGGVAWWSLGIAILLTGIAWIRPLPPTPSPRAQRGWTVVVVAALAGSLARAILRLEVVDAGVDFLFLLIVQRFFNRQKAREHMQLLLLSSLLMVVGAVINTDLNYPLLFAAYLFTAAMSLIVNHLLSEGERLGPRVQAEVRRAASRSASTLWRAAGQVAAMAALGGLLVFVLFPRFGVGVFLRGSMARNPRSGFSSEVELGGFGRIKSDPTVIARLVPLEGLAAVPRLDWHLRGSSLDTYDQGRWRHGEAAAQTEVDRIGSFTILTSRGVPRVRLHSRGLQPRPIPGIAASEEAIHVRATLEDQGVDVLFVASEPLAVGIRARGSLENRARIRAGTNDELRADKPPGPIQYDFVSRIGVPTPDELRAVGIPDVPDELRGLARRSTGLTDDVTRLATSLAAGRTTRFDQVSALVDHLAGFEYTLDLDASPRVEAGADPVEGFLFDTQRGHCEYFATALAVLARELGIPSRIVNGYYGAQYNDLGDYYAVRQADAHSWVEIHFGPLGWVTFDPTPASGRMAGANPGWWPAFSQAVDALRNAYLQYVIDYDLQKQLALLDEAGITTRYRGHRPRIDWRNLAWWSLPAFGIGAVIVVWRRRRTPTTPLPTRLYARILADFARRGHARRPDESAPRFAQRLVAQGVPGAGAFAEFATLYERSRFGRDPSDAEDALRRAAKATHAALG